MIKVKGALRCAYCHGDAQGLLEGCDACGALVHADCRRELGRCSTLGCHAASAQKIAVAALPPGRQVGAALRRATSALFSVMGLLACLGCCAWFTSVTRAPRPNPLGLQAAHALVIRAASARFESDFRRPPRSLEELLMPRGGGSYLEGYAGDLDRYLFVRRGRVVWIAVGIESDEDYETETIRLIRVLYEDPLPEAQPATSVAPLVSSAW